jgi:hypothetical protein
MESRRASGTRVGTKSWKGILATRCSLACWLSSVDQSHQYERTHLPPANPRDGTAAIRRGIQANGRSNMLGEVCRGFTFAPRRKLAKTVVVSACQLLRPLSSCKARSRSQQAKLCAVLDVIRFTAAWVRGCGVWIANNFWSASMGGWKRGNCVLSFYAAFRWCPDMHGEDSTKCSTEMSRYQANCFSTWVRGCENGVWVRYT